MTWFSFFFFKQKTAYEMRISDGSSDVCSSDLITRNFVLVVAQNHRLFALPAMIEAYLAELARRRGEIAAKVTSARTLSDAQQAALLETLRASVGSKVQLDLKVDPALIGGLVVKIGRAHV